VVICSLSKCSLLWHLSLEAHPIHKRGLVKEINIFLEWLSGFYSIAANLVFFLTCFIFLIVFYIKVFMLGITMQLDISARLTPQVTTIICHHMKKVLLKKEKERKYKNMGGLDQNPHVNKNDT